MILLATVLVLAGWNSAIHIRHERITFYRSFLAGNAAQTVTDREVVGIVERFDVNGDGELDKDEWLELAAIMFLGKGERELKNETFAVSNRRRHVGWRCSPATRQLKLRHSAALRPNPSALGTLAHAY